MGAVRNILQAKGAKVFSIPSNTSVYQALEIMVEKNVSSLMVMEDEKLLGIFTERDYARKVILKGKASRDTAIADIMTSQVITVTPDSSIDECMQIMSGKFIRHLPVVENGKLLAMISIRDLLESTMQEQKYLIQQLEQYIRGESY